MSREPEGVSSQEPGKAVVEWIDMIDARFSRWKVSTLYIWLTPIILLIIAIDVTILSSQDLGSDSPSQLPA